MRIMVKPEVRNNAMTSVLIKPHFFLAPIITDFIRNTKITLWWEARRRAWNARFGIEQRRWHQDAVQPVKLQSTSPRKCVQHKCSSTGEKADGSAFQTAGRWWSSASAGTRSACRNRHNVVFRSRHTVTFKRRVRQNPSRVATLGRTPW